MGNPASPTSLQEGLEQRGAGGQAAADRDRSSRGLQLNNSGAKRDEAPVETPEQQAMLRSLGVDGFQLSPLLGKMAADLLCGGSIAEVDPGFVLLSRPAMGVCVAKTLASIDPWDQLNVLQRGEGDLGSAQQRLAEKQQGEDDAEERRRAYEGAPGTV